MYIFYIEAYKDYKLFGYFRFENDNAYIVKNRSRATYLYDRESAYQVLDMLQNRSIEGREGVVFKLKTL